MGSSLAYAAATVEDYIDSYVAAARLGNVEAFMELGMIYASGSGGTVVDLVEAHKWFNLAAAGGSEQAHFARADIAGEMSAREIAVAQKAARAFQVETRA